MSTSPVELPLWRPDPLTPPPAHAELRRRSPVASVNTPWGPAWLVTAAEPARLALADPRLGITPPGVEVDVRASLFRDGAEHARLRRLVAAAFRPVRIAAMRPRLEALAEEYVARLVLTAPPVDLVAALAAPLPVAVVAELVGIASERRDRFRELVDAVLTIDPTATEGPAAEAGWRAWAELTAFVTELVATRRAEPAHDRPDDLLSDLLAVRDTDDGRLDDDELVALVGVLVAAGTLTVRNALVLAVLRLLQEGTFAELTDEGVAPVVEEVVRRAGTEPFPRFARDDLELAGVAIARGDMVLISLEAANHDPDRFAEPDRFRPAREENHLGFGHGPHHCLGAALARAGLGAVLPVLARRLPALRLAVDLAEIPWHRGLVDSGPLELPVSWSTPWS